MALRVHPYILNLSIELKNKNIMRKEIIITIIGAGSWGTTLAVILAREGYHINLWARSEGTAKITISGLSKPSFKFINGLTFSGMVKSPVYFMFLLKFFISSCVPSLRAHKFIW
ncbi:hypothetical protein ES708_32218 [subsurface metagenome]